MNSFFLKTADGLYYTGRAGDGWLSRDKAEAFEYAARGNAEYKRDLFNRGTALHGADFRVVCA